MTLQTALISGSMTSTRPSPPARGLQSLPSSSAARRSGLALFAASLSRAAGLRAQGGTWSLSGARCGVQLLLGLLWLVGCGELEPLPGEAGAPGDAALEPAQQIEAQPPPAPGPATAEGQQIPPPPEASGAPEAPVSLLEAPLAEGGGPVIERPDSPPAPGSTAPRVGVAAAEPASASPAPQTAVFKSVEGEWPMWGGSPSRNLVNLQARGIPTTWDVKSGKNVKWRAELGSQSYGNPVVAGGKVLVGTNNQAKRNPAIEGDKGIVMCFDAESGKFLWQAVHDKLESGKVNDWPEQGVCSTACVEGDRFYYVSNRAELVCADLEGFLDGENDGPLQSEKRSSATDADFVWTLDLMEELGVFPHNMATSSPLVVGDLVFIHTSNGVEKDHVTIPSPSAPSFIAVNKETGKLVWSSSAPGDKILHGQWSSPTYSVAGGRPQVIFPGGDGWLYSFEPREGQLLWKFNCNPSDAVYDLGGKGTRNEIVATAVAAGDRVMVGVGQDPEHGEGNGHLYSVDATRSGDVTAQGPVWHVGGKDFRRTISTVAVHDGLVYAVDLSGFLQCLDEATGKSYWTHDMLAAVWGSPSWIDGHIYLGDEDGDVAVLQAGKELKLLGEINMENSVYSTPVAAGAVLYIANRTTLFALQEGKTP